MVSGYVVGLNIASGHRRYRSMRGLIILLLSLSAVLTGCADESDRRRDPVEGPYPTVVSLSAVVANPERFDGQYIATEGVVATSYYDWHIFFDREDYDAYRTLNGASLSLFDTVEPHDERTLRRLEGRSVYLDGVFYDGVSGHMGMQRGLIVVRSITEAPVRRELDGMYEFSPVPWPLPWLYIIAALTGLALAVAIARRLRSGGGRTQTVLSRALAFAISAFTVVEVWAAAHLLLESFYLERWVIYAGLALASGVVGLVLMWVFYRRRLAVLMLLMVGLQLAAPIAREVYRIDTWESQLRYPFYAQTSHLDWRRAQWPAARAPELTPREELGEAPLPRPVFAAPEAPPD